MKLFRKEYLPLILVAAAIALSPSFSAGEIGEGRIIEIRIEDILLVILGILWLANFLISGRKKIEKPPLFLPILAWLGIGLFSVLVNWILGNTGISRSFFFFLKEVEFFFLYFYVFFHIKNLDAAKFFVKLWIILGFMNVGWVIYQIIRGSRFVTEFGFRSGTYGASAIGEYGPLPTGAFFLLLLIFLFNVFLYYFLNLNISKFKKGILGILIIGLVAGVFGSASKTSFVAMVLALFLTPLFLFLRKVNFKVISVFILAIVFMVTSLFFIIENFPKAKRLTATFSLEGIWENYKAGRLEVVIEPMLKESFESSVYLPVFGLGKGHYAPEAHNQYLRNFVETGVIGSLIFFILIFAVIKGAWHGFSKSHDGFAIGLSSGLLVATITLLFVSFATEAFIVVKPMEVYWFFAALTMAVLTISKKEAFPKEKL